MLLAFAPVAQLDRALVYGTKGYKFESCQAHFHNSLLVKWLCLRQTTWSHGGKTFLGRVGQFWGS